MLGAAVLRCRHSYLLQGALEATTEQERWMGLLGQRASCILDPTWRGPDAIMRGVQMAPPTYTDHPLTCPCDGAQRCPIAGTADSHCNTACDMRVLHAERMFVAGDSAAQQRASAFVPAGFRLGAISTECRALVNDVLRPFMMLRVTIEGWPPPHSSRRTRVHAYDPITNHTAVEVLAAHRSGTQVCESSAIDVADALARYRPAREVCTECRCYFGSIWMCNDRCFVCDQRIRMHNDRNACPFQCKYGDKGAYCNHAKRCFTCDSPHTCNECRLACGDGEMVADLVKTLQPQLLLFDFDRTLASTKSGASPLPPPGSSKPITHTVDQDLKSAALWSEGEHEVHVVTRNSHKAAIQQFLTLNGLGHVEVHVVPKKMRKGQYIKETFFHANDTDEQISPKDGSDEHDTINVRPCIFVDDDIKELVADQWLRESSNIHRVLFLRVLY
eukprot:m.198083 g.198083  ORF g.198083 m.198083 type:complete len:444 (+) comp18733_c0_seq1:1618-2949(+)